MPDPTASESGSRPVFVVGSPRSGTSMLHWALCQHPSLWGSEESELFPPLVRHLDAIYSAARQFSGHNWMEAQGVGIDEFYGHLGRGIASLYESRSGGSDWVEQTPSNTWVLEGILRLLPGARFIHIHRDGRQVVESMRASWNWTLIRAARIWREANARAREFQLRHPDMVLRVSYEDMVADPAAALQRIWIFLDLTPCEESVRFIAEKAPINAATRFANQQSRDKLAPRHANWWWGRKRLFNVLAGREMDALGYRLD